jgi:hypothetical protein
MSSVERNTATTFMYYAPNKEHLDSAWNMVRYDFFIDRLCGLVVRILDYRSRGPGFDSRALQKKVVGLERSPLSLVSTTEELLDRKVAAPV